MARADLIVNLVKASVVGDQQGARSVTEAIVAEERAKQHTVLAERLEQVLRINQPRTSGTGLNGRHPAKDYLYDVSPRRRLADLTLPPLVETVCRRLVDEQLGAAMLRAHGLDPRHRVLLVGPPGNGKTSVAEALAEAMAVPFLVVRYETLVGSFLGETAGRLKRVFEYARTMPCVLFFDEFDAVGKERGDVHETGEIKRVVASLLMQMDDLPAHTVLLAASNHPELLDRATWRRFQLRLSLPAPTPHLLETYLSTFLTSFDEPAGMAAKTMVKHLGAISFAEVEEFTLDIRRHRVLALGKRTLKAVVKDVLEQWRERRQAVAGQQQ